MIFEQIDKTDKKCVRFRLSTIRTWSVVMPLFEVEQSRRA